METLTSEFTSDKDTCDYILSYLNKAFPEECFVYEEYSDNLITVDPIVDMDCGGILVVNNICWIAYQGEKVVDFTNRVSLFTDNHYWDGKTWIHKDYDIERKNFRLIVDKNRKMFFDVFRYNTRPVYVNDLVESLKMISVSKK